MLRRRMRKSKKPVYRKRRQFGVRRPRTSTKSSQVFSETQKCGTECAGVNSSGQIVIPALQLGAGFNLVTQMNVIPQSAQQSALQQAYKIIKAKFTIIPKWGPETFNEASLGTAGAIPIAESARIAYAINDVDPDLAAPLTETSVLVDNGCRVRMFTKPTVITVRPKPQLAQQNPSAGLGFDSVNVYQNRGQWIAFDSKAAAGAGGLVPHTGATGFISKDNSLNDGFLAVADVQCTVSFVLKDPR